MTLDTTRADRLGCYGHAAARTPVLDRLAAAGVRFERVLSVQPLTLPAHASILTGTLPPVHGIRDNGHRPLPQEATTLAEELGRSGYRTAAFIGAVVLAREFALDQGFLHYDDRIEPQGARAVPMLERPAAEVNRALFRHLEQSATAEAPLFFWVHYYDPHAPYAAPEAYRAPGADEYDSELAYVDAELGRLLDFLERRRQRPRLVAVTADHGEALADHKEPTHGYFIYDATMHVPLILWSSEPGTLASGRVVEGAWQVTDVAPTLLAAAGVAAPPAMTGQSLLPFCAPGDPPAAPAGRPLWLESYYAHFRYGWSYALGYEKEGFKLIDLPRPELYDVARDRAEQQDLFQDPAHRGRAELYMKELRAWHERLAADALAVAEPAADAAAAGRTQAMLAQLGYLPGKHEIDPEQRGADLKEMLPYDKQFLRSRTRIAVAAQAGDPAAALAMVERALQTLHEVRARAARTQLVDAELANGLVLKGRLLERLGRAGERRAAAAQIVDLLAGAATLSAPARLDLAAAYEWLDRPADALAELRRAVAENPWSEPARQRLAEAERR